MGAPRGMRIFCRNVPEGSPGGPRGAPEGDAYELPIDCRNVPVGSPGGPRGVPEGVAYELPTSCLSRFYAPTGKSALTGKKVRLPRGKSALTEIGAYPGGQSLQSAA